MLKRKINGLCSFLRRSLKQKDYQRKVGIPFMVLLGCAAGAGWVGQPLVLPPSQHPNIRLSVVLTCFGQAGADDTGISPRSRIRSSHQDDCVSSIVASHF